MCTVVEAAGLLFVIAVGIAFLATDVSEPVADESNAVNWPPWRAIGQAAAVAFFAFIGFEDMVNVAEEVCRISIHPPLSNR